MKKIILMLAAVFLFSNKAFSQFEIHVMAPLSMSFIFPQTSGKVFVPVVDTALGQTAITGNAEKTAISLGASGLMQIGYNFDLKNETGITGISLLADLGYYMQSLGVNFKVNSLFGNSTYQNLIFFHTLNLGVVHKLNIYVPNVAPFSVGIGYGVRIPFSASGQEKFAGYEEEYELSYSDIQDTFSNYLIPYVKIMFDGYYYVSNKIALTLGTHISYNFCVNYNESVLAPYGLTKMNLSSLDVAITFGIYFGKANPKKK